MHLSEHNVWTYRNTPDAPNLTKNPQSLGKDAVKGIKNALPDVSYVPTKEDIIKKVSQC